jgi:hypothetical protein
MLSKREEFKKAILLRKKGQSYTEISKVVSVSKSTLSLWLSKIELSTVQYQSLHKKQNEGRLKGALIRKGKREKDQANIIMKAHKEISQISNRELWLLGIMAYWCEGAKQKSNNISQPVVFSNSDPILVKLFISWLRNVCMIKDNDIVYSLYIHKNADIQAAQSNWSNILGISEDLIGKPILKKHKLKTKRHNIGSTYNGLIRIAVKRSTNLNRKITGWVQGINQNI